MAKKKAQYVPIRVQLLVATGIVCILILSGCLIAWLDRNTHFLPDNRSYSGVTLKGTIVCLPHKGNGPATEECALGLRTASGTYYALRNAGNRTNDVVAEISGVLTAPPDNTPYRIDGVLTVN